MSSQISLFFLFCLWLPPAHLGHVTIYPEDPYSQELMGADYLPEQEAYTNLTIDQAILQSYDSSYDYMHNHFMSPDGSLLAELDMRLSTGQFEALYGSGPQSGIRQKRKATRSESLRWTNGVVPYEFVTSHFSASEVYTMKKAMQEWQDATCLTFRPASYADRNRIRLQNGNGCNSALGMVGGTQIINLQTPGCRYKGLYLHEVGHAIGLVHEHQLPDRDTYIHILYANVSPALRIWFNKYSTREVNQYGVPYEYSSVMHYGVTAFSIDGRRKTIQVRDPSREAEIGNVWRKGLSFSDIKVVNLMYQCNRHCPTDPTCADPGYLDKNCRCVCPTNVNCVRAVSTTTTRAPTTTTALPSPSTSTTTTTTEGGEGGTGTTSTTVTSPAPSSSSTGPSGSTTSTTAPVTTTWMPSPPPSTTTTTTTTTTGGGRCYNLHNDRDCVYWAGRGECSRNPLWMRPNCRKACNMCSGGGGGGGRRCQDKHVYCGYWSRTGYCRSSAYMRTNCARACRFCT